MIFITNILNKLKPKKMDKNKALERLAQIEVETAELKKIINQPADIKDRVKTFADACNVLNVRTVGQACNYLGIKYDYSSSETSIYETNNYALKLKIIVFVLNEGWKPNMEDSNQLKYEPYFKKTSSGFVYYNYSYCTWDCDTPISLLFETSEKARYAGEQFIKEYNDYLNN